MNSLRHDAITELMSTYPTDGPNVSPLTPKYDIEAVYGKDIFDLRVMRQRLPQDIYKKMDAIINRGERITSEVANIVANAMKDWAIEHGATHYTHWFQPMSGCTAEKHDAFANPTPDGMLINKFSGKTLISGEPDASSFPSGGIRSTFEARGYTTWDPRVPAFLMPGKFGHTLNVPTVFYSYSGEALDRKIPLLRSIDALSKSTVRVLRLFGNEKATFARAMVGPEQEYFLVDSRLAALRPDILATGRTLIGACDPKGQELEDHYFGSIPKRVEDYMQDVEVRLFSLGIPAHTRHNEVAPGQFELAALYEEANLATDHNMLIMNILRATAHEHGFKCLLHEKPFAKVNGSGKHNNWSIADSEGNNLLEPGDTPSENAQFLLFLGATLRAVHLHASTLRLGTFGAGNDHRLGANEAPPAIISAYLGEQLTSVLESIISGASTKDKKKTGIEIGVSSLPELPKDFSDRNRTSPFAFTGNKFEFRSVGSSASVSPVNFCLNSAVSCALEDVADELDKYLAKGMTITEALQEYLPILFKEHMPVVFNGNGYSEEWRIEAEQRGLLNLNNTVKALAQFTQPEVIEVFKRANVLSEREIEARQEVFFDQYVKSIQIEASVLNRMLTEQIIPVVQKEQNKLAQLVINTKAVMNEAKVEEEQFKLMRENYVGLVNSVKELEKAFKNIKNFEHVEAQADFACYTIVPLMEECRKYSDTLEVMIDDNAWPLPKYSELLWVH